MQTIIIYNGVRIKDVHTDSIEHLVEKDSTGVDQVGVRVTATFTGIVHTSTINNIGVKVAEQNEKFIAEEFAPGISALLARLTKDRRRFTMTIAGLPLYDVFPGATDSSSSDGSPGRKSLIDIANGPIPSAELVKITSGNSATIRFSITFVIPNCGGQGNLNPSGLINFRFNIFEDIDAGGSWATTRTYTGRIRVAHKNISPHALARVVTVPPLERGFQRRIINWHESSDGLHLDFTFQDQEKYASAPWNRFAGTGATDWSGTLKMSSNTFGITGIAELDFRLKGPLGVSKVDLMDIAFRICQAKARMFDFAPGGKNFKQGYMEYFGMSESLHENEIAVQCRIMHTGSGEPGRGIGLLTLGNDRVLGQATGDLGIGYDPLVHFQPGPTAGIGGLFLSLLSTPCNPGGMPQAAQTRVRKPKQGRLDDQGGFGQLQESLGQSGSNASQSQLEGMYLEYNLESEIISNSGRIALPTGAASNSRSFPLAVVNLYRPTAIREIRIDASRINFNPELPTPDIAFVDQNNIVHEMIDIAKVSAIAPQVSADNRKLLFRSRMQMQFALSRVPNVFDRIPVGCVPYRAVDVNDPSRSIMPNSFVSPESILR